MNITLLRRGVAVAGAALALSGGAALAATAPPAGAAQFGSVDLPRITAGYTKRAAMDQQIQGLQARLKSDVDQLLVSPMLNKQDQDQLGALLAKPTQTDADKVTIGQLQQKSQQASQQLTALQQKTTPLTDTEKATMADLQAEQTLANNKQIDPDIANSYAAQMQQLNDQLTQQLTADVKAAITAVAKERGLAIVFDSQVAVYTANDISDEVLKRLNK